MAKTQDQRKVVGDLVRTIERLTEMTEELSEDQLRVRPAENKWSIKEIIGHLAAFEEVVVGRFKAMYTKDNPTIDSYDTDAWAATDHIDEDFDESLERFTVARKKTTNILKRLKDKEWLRPGRHPELPNYSIQIAAERLAAHDSNHLKQIENIKKIFGA